MIFNWRTSGYNGYLTGELQGIMELKLFNVGNVLSGVMGCLGYGLLRAMGCLRLLFKIIPVLLVRKDVYSGYGITMG
ncbi:hypothetical protein A994_07360 [Methanobacterium formicicum DSM 3637]|uniref:Uncharacterized protein n=2 Tax=Methanobacterium formicicum TaxID=2162 RepID=K2RT29_METFP|nr:hypothetical protein A994_07360 [Methanobacterium formicicum DSM 3637]